MAGDRCDGDEGMEKRRRRGVTRARAQPGRGAQVTGCGVNGTPWGAVGHTLVSVTWGQNMARCMCSNG